MAGRLSSKVKPGGETIEYDYYPSGKIKKAEYFNAAGEKKGATEFTYNASG
jgi:hypothetical protein